MSGIIDKAKDTLGHHTAKHDTEHGSTNAGPHNSNATNKLDPRVDNRENPGSSIGGYKHGAAEGPYSGSTFGTAGTGAARSTAGPHDTDFLNKADPRVDSDKDNSMKIGGDKTNA